MQTEREEAAFLTLLTYPLAYRLLWPHSMYIARITTSCTPDCIACPCVPAGSCGLLARARPLRLAWLGLERVLAGVSAIRTAELC